MPNFQSWPQSIYPATGDLLSTTGGSGLVVDGIQQVPVSNTLPADQQVLVFMANNGQYIPNYSPFNRSVQINGVAVSDDYDIAINLSVGPAFTPVEINGSLV